MRAPALLLHALLCCLLALPARAEGPPTRAALQRALEAHARSAVQVSGSGRAGPGVIVGAGGQVLTSVQQVGLYEAEVRGRAGAASERAPVLMANAALKVALVRLRGEDHPAASVALLPRHPGRPWLIGIQQPGGKRARAVAGRAAPARAAPFLRVPLALAPGSPLFDTQGRLVAVAVARRGAHACDALPLSALEKLLERAQ
ncbi:MAG TPA: serine protease [Aggregicoccus sp.]|nr:serine protease [Aggregicoccus sp.]